MSESTTKQRESAQWFLERYRQNGTGVFRRTFYLTDTKWRLQNAFTKHRDYMEREARAFLEQEMLPGEWGPKIDDFTTFIPDPKDPDRVSFRVYFTPTNLAASVDAAHRILAAVGTQ